MKPLTRLFALFICAVFLVTTQAMAMARGQAPAERALVLCTSHGTVQIYLDAQGKPTSSPELCADALLTVVAVDADFVRWTGQCDAPRALAHRILHVPVLRSPPGVYAARAPPSVAKFHELAA